jgi:hypothetical protein
MRSVDVEEHESEEVSYTKLLDTRGSSRTSKKRARQIG